jgi:hypothetical protein
MKSSSQTNRFPIGSIVGEYHLKEKRYIDHFFICGYGGNQYTFCRVADIDDKNYKDGLDDNQYYEYHLVSDGI